MRALLSRLAAPLAAVRWLMVGLIWGHGSWWPAALAQPPRQLEVYALAGQALQAGLAAARHQGRPPPPEFQEFLRRNAQVCSFLEDLI